MRKNIYKNDWNKNKKLLYIGSKIIKKIISKENISANFKYIIIENSAIFQIIIAIVKQNKALSFTRIIKVSTSFLIIK